PRDARAMAAGDPRRSATGEARRSSAGAPFPRNGAGTGLGQAPVRRRSSNPLSGREPGGERPGGSRRLPPRPRPWRGYEVAPTARGVEAYRVGPRPDPQRHAVRAGGMTAKPLLLRG